jgi:hypothetical protein
MDLRHRQDPGLESEILLYSLASCLVRDYTMASKVE